MIKNSSAELINFATEKLSASGIDSPRLDAEILLAHVLNCRRLNLYVDPKKILSDEQISRYKKIISQREKNFPVAYLVGSREFMGLDFAVSEEVLIPRPDTEILTQAAIDYLNKLDGKKFFADLGTGSGAIAISILSFVKGATAAATDISSRAIEVAELNAKNLNVAERIKFFRGDLFEPLTGKKFHAVVSNPPYIPTDELPKLQAEVRREPRIALDGGADGLNFYRKIVEGAPKFLLPEGFLALEVGIGQAEEVSRLIAGNGNFFGTEILRDLAGIERVVTARRL